MVLRATELAAIAEIAVAADLLVITDEVYEHLVFDSPEGPPTCRWPGFDGMAERTITISSAAKMFNCTGWKIGWACGPAELIAGVRAAKQYLSYVGGAPFQPAVALALDTQDAWVAALRNSLQARRDRLAAGLTEIGFEVHDSYGTYFVCADPRPLGYDDSTAFCAALPERVGVAAIPMSAFCDPAAERADVWNHLVRFTFCKREDTLDEAIRRLALLQGPPITRLRRPSVAELRIFFRARLTRNSGSGADGSTVMENRTRVFSSPSRLRLYSPCWACCCMVFRRVPHHPVGPPVIFDQFGVDQARHFDGDLDVMRAAIGMGIDNFGAFVHRRP